MEVAPPQKLLTLLSLLTSIILLTLLKMLSLHSLLTLLQHCLYIGTFWLECSSILGMYVYGFMDFGAKSGSGLNWMDTP